MGNIRVLTDLVASQVAAGEVVDRPASIVKELIENSLDANAKRVHIEFFQGGTTLIRVADDGIGMDREDALLSLERHATSKLRIGRDLESILTFGFRGEALPSIASVSKFRLVTRCREAETGTEILVNGGRIEAVRESGEGYGTKVEVRSLFFNVPARRKFLRGLQTEAGHIIHQLHCLALAHPNVAFVAMREGRKFIELAPTQDLEVRVRELLGLERVGRLIKGEPLEVGKVRIHGFLSQPARARQNRSEQFIFVNGRAIVSPAVSAPLREAYYTILPKGYQPEAILFLEMDPTWIDCNVHPAKREVRFRDTAAVGEAVRQFAEKVLAGRTMEQSATHFERSSEMPVISPLSSPPISQLSNSRSEHLFSSPALSHATSASAEALLSKEEIRSAQVSHEEKICRDLTELPEQLEIQNLLQLREVTVLGKVANRFAILDGSFGMVIVDLRAACERILFERLLSELKNGQVHSQALLLPVIFDLPPRDIAWIIENLELLQRVGVAVECFGGSSVKVEAVPASINRMEIQEFLVRLIHDLIRGGIRSGQRIVEEALARSVARLVGGEAIPTELERIDALVQKLLQCELPYSCPAGKATMIALPLSELKRRFGFNI